MSKKDKPGSAYKTIKEIGLYLDQKGKEINKLTYSPEKTIIINKHAIKRYTERFLNIPKYEISEYVKNHETELINNITLKIKSATVPKINISKKHRSYLNKTYNIDYTVFLQEKEKLFVCSNPAYNTIIVITCFKVNKIDEHGIIYIERKKTVNKI